MSAPEVRPLTAHDLDDVARIHLAAFPESLLSRLGGEAARRYYAWQLLGPHDVTAHGARIGPDLVGFCFGGVFRGAMSGFLRKNRGYLVLRVLGRPGLLAEVFRSQRIGRIVANSFRVRARGPAATEPAPSAFGILAIAVEPGRQGLGIGQALMQAAETAAVTQRFTRMELTVRPDNERARRFYESQGWSITSRTAETIGMAKTIGSATTTAPHLSV